MSFSPITGGPNSSLLGSGNARILRLDKGKDKDLYSKKLSYDQPNTIIVIILSAIIFVAIISIYDVGRNYINNRYAKIALEDTRSQNSQKEIDSTLISNYQSLLSSIVFCIISVVLAAISIPIYSHYYN
jgi:hypothetical protein